MDNTSLTSSQSKPIEGASESYSGSCGVNGVAIKGSDATDTIGSVYTVRACSDECAYHKRCDYFQYEKNSRTCILKTHKALRWRGWKWDESVVSGTANSCSTACGIPDLSFAEENIEESENVTS